MSKCQRHSVQLLTARTVNDRRRRPLSPPPSPSPLNRVEFVLPCATLDKRMQLVSGSTLVSRSLSLFLCLPFSGLVLLLSSSLCLSAAVFSNCGPRGQIFCDSRARSRMLAGVLYSARTSLFKGRPSSVVDRLILALQQLPR